MPNSSVSEKGLARYTELRIAGSTAKEAQAKSGVKSHAAAEYHFLRNAPVANGGLKERVGSEAKDPANVVKLRNSGLSWGRITVLCDFPNEAQCRNAFTEGSKLRSQGLRVGRGGRWFLNDQELYADVLQPTGTEIPKDRPEGMGVRELARHEAASQRLIRTDIKELREIYRSEVGGDPGQRTPAALAIEIMRKRTGAEPTKAKKGKKAKATS